MKSDKTKWMPIGEVIEDIIDRRGVTVLKLGGDFVSQGHRVISAKLLKDRTVNLDADVARYITSEIYKKWMRTPLKKGDILMTSEAPLGELAYLQEDKDWALGQRLFAIRPRSEIINGRYLYYVLQTNSVREDIQARATGTTVQGIRQSELRLVKVPIPDLSVQTSAANFLGTIDDRITLLKETNLSLEAITQTLFKSWFVDFDPVHAKQKGVQPEGIDEETAALFSDSFEQSELGEIPKNWSVEPLDELFDFKEGPGIRNWQYTNSDKGTRFINIRLIKDGDLKIESANRITDEEANGKYLHFHLNSWDIVVSTSGTLGRSAIVRKEHLPLLLNTSVIRFRPIEGKSTFSFLYLYLNFPEFLYKLESMASGSVQKNFGPMHLRQIKLVTPNINVLEKFDSVCFPIFEKIIENRTQIADLESIRDTLLPYLISGQIRPTDTKEQIEEVS
jgi:type I restriction enzyme S subunit